MATAEQIATVRALIPDTDEPYMFSDPELAAYIDSNDGDLYLATADALEALATKMVFAGGASEVRTDDLTVKDSTSIDLIYARAQRMRDKSAAALSDEFQIVYPFGGDIIPEATPSPYGEPWRWGRVRW